MTDEFYACRECGAFESGKMTYEYVLMRSGRVVETIFLNEETDEPERHFKSTIREGDSICSGGQEVVCEKCGQEFKGIMVMSTEREV